MERSNTGLWKGVGRFLALLQVLLHSAAAVGAADDPSLGSVPSPVTFTVRAGERVSDLAARWEGMRISSAAALSAVAAREAFADFALVSPPRPEASRFEGLFLPGSYTVDLPLRGAGETSRRYQVRCTVALITALLRQADAVHRALSSRRGLSPYQLLILASTIEKEAVGGTGYRRVAAVFFNRLAARMELGSCPTLEYALGFHRPFLTWSDLRFASPYNTYRHKGLPPTPIAFPGPEALAAVQQPAPSGDLFFVFDWTTGQLLFSRTYQEHQRQARLAEENYARRYGLAAVHRKYPGVFYRPVNRP